MYTFFEKIRYFYIFTAKINSSQCHRQKVQKYEN